MILLNFSHPLTHDQRAQISELAGQPITRFLDTPCHFDEQQPFRPQMVALLSDIDLSAAEWQHETILLVLPSLSFIAALLLAELHGRMGCFPTVVRMRPAADSLPRRFEVAELLNLQAVREAARRSR